MRSKKGGDIGGEEGDEIVRGEGGDIGGERPNRWRRATRSSEKREARSSKRMRERERESMLNLMRCKNDVQKFEGNIQ